MNERKYKAVGCDIFAGGFTCGLMDLFEIDTHLEHGTYGRNIKDLNLPHVQTYMKPWPKISTDFIYCNPPCAPWSMASAGRKTSWDEDPRLECFTDAVQLINTWPNFLAIESVLATWRKAEKFIREQAAYANSLGYEATIILHDGQYLNMAQTRRRMFLVFHNLKIAWHKAKFYNPIACDVMLSNPPVQTEGDMILAANEHVKYLMTHRRPEDTTLLAVHDRLGFRSGVGSMRPVFTSSICRQGHPAPTLLHCMHAHPTQHRYLSVNEMARLCGYPDWWSWNVKAGVQARASLIARGVTPSVSRWLGELVTASLDWNQECDPVTTVVDCLNGKVNK